MSYLLRSKQKKMLLQEQRLVVLGCSLGLVLGTFAWVQVFLVSQASEALWFPVIYLGFFLACVGLVWPSGLRFVEKGLGAIGSVLGFLLTQIIMFTLYFLVLSPLGVFQQKLYGTGPFFWWQQNNAPNIRSAWKPLPSTQTVSGKDQLAARGVGSQLVKIIKFFVGAGRYFYLPLLILLLVLGLVFFLVQSSVLAPLIYTLF